MGPCSLEEDSLYFSIGQSLHTLMKGKTWFFKASFDKANRSSLDGKRGVGLDKAIDVFREMKNLLPDIKLTTDVHETWQVEKLTGIIDCIQVPAFLCRQTDLIVECARHFDIVNIKKGQWMNPENMVKGVDKIKNTNPKAEAWITERGSQFGYNQLIVDFSAVEVLSKYFDKVILDVTHSTQRIKPNGRTGGDRNLAIKYMLTAGIFGYDGIFAETHPFPEKAFSDGDCQIVSDEMSGLVRRVEKINLI